MESLLASCPDAIDKRTGKVDRKVSVLAGVWLAALAARLQIHTNLTHLITICVRCNLLPCLFESRTSFSYRSLWEKWSLFILLKISFVCCILSFFLSKECFSYYFHAFRDGQSTVADHSPEAWVVFEFGNVEAFQVRSSE